MTSALDIIQDLAVRVLCSRCSEPMAYHSLKGTFHCDICQLDHRGPSKAEARAESTHVGKHSPAR